MTVNAYDSKGNIYSKEVTFPVKKNGKRIISFGGYCRYYVDMLLAHYPFDRPLNIDMGGLNHKGNPVYVSAADMNKIFEHLFKEEDYSEVHLSNSAT